MLKKNCFVVYLKRDIDKKIIESVEVKNRKFREIIPDDFENVPTEGFVLNKRAGGYKSGWNFRQTKCRVWDPRGFEIEISIENLLYILQECTSTKGKGLEGTFVYAWNGPELILLPTCCEDYICSTELQNRQEKIAVKDLKVGASYKGKEYDYLIYIGKMDWYIWEEKEEKKLEDFNNTPVSELIDESLRVKPREKKEPKQNKKATSDNNMQSLDF